MPLVTCPGCGEDTFTISGWADTDHCPYCGRSLADRVVAFDPEPRADRELEQEDRPPSGKPGVTVGSRP